jgi:hypothetical protein
VTAAPRTELPRLAAAMWKAHAAGAIGDTEAQGLAEAIEARKFTADQLEGRHGPPVRL